MITALGVVLVISGCIGLIFATGAFLTAIERSMRRRVRRVAAIMFAAAIVIWIGVLIVMRGLR